MNFHKKTFNILPEFVYFKVKGEVGSFSTRLHLFLAFWASMSLQIQSC